MFANRAQIGRRAELNLTATSTLKHLIGVSITCVALWVIIAATINS